MIIPLSGAYSINDGSLNVTTLSVGGGSIASTLSVSGSGQVTTAELNNSNSVQVSGGTLDFTTLNNNGSFSWTGGAGDALRHDLRQFDLPHRPSAGCLTHRFH